LNLNIAGSEANKKAKIKEQKYKAKCKNSGGGVSFPRRRLEREKHE